MKYVTLVIEENSDGIVCTVLKMKGKSTMVHDSKVFEHGDSPLLMINKCIHMTGSAGAEIVGQILIAISEAANERVQLVADRVLELWHPL